MRDVRSTSSGGADETWQALNAQSSLTFRADGTFTIVQFTDLHWRDGDARDVASRALMGRVLEAETPDLVVFTGDLVASYAASDPLASFRSAVESVQERGLPWVVTFGNHDTERGITRMELLQAVCSSAGSLNQYGSAEISGYGNGVLPVRDNNGRCRWLLYFLDSGNESDLPHVSGYDWIRRDQIDWYAKVSALAKSGNENVPFPALAFFHIPLPEYETAWSASDTSGSKLEAVCCAQLNSGLFAAMVEAGDVVGTFVGHDHLNDYCGTVHGIRLCYGRATGYNGYGRKGFARGARVIRIHSHARVFDTWVHLDQIRHGFDD